MSKYDYFRGNEAEQFSFIRIPKAMIRNKELESLSMEAVFLYGILLDRTEFSRKNGWIDMEGRVYIIYPIEELMEVTGRCKNTVLSLMRKLVKIGLLEQKRQGRGLPNILYVKNFMKKKDEDNAVIFVEAEENISEVQDMDSMKFNRRTSSGSNNQLLEVQNMNPSNTEINKTDIINTERVNTKSTYGRFYNVFLKDEELELLQTEYPDSWKQWIERLSEYMSSSGKKYENHYATMCLWAGREKQKKVKNYEDTNVMHL